VGLVAALTLPSTALGQVKFYGYSFAEDDYLGYHFTGDLEGYGNLIGYTYKDDVTPPGSTFASNHMKVWLDIPTDEALLSGSSMSRQATLNDIKTDVVNGSMLNLVAFISPSEEWFTRLHISYTQGSSGEFHNWAIFNTCSGLCSESASRAILKSYLEDLIDDIKAVFQDANGQPKVILVENGWSSSSAPPPDNLDVLGLDAYYIQNSTDCDSTEKTTYFDPAVTDLYDLASSFGKPMMMVAGSFSQVSPSEIPTSCQLEWYFELATSGTYDIIGIHWFLYHTTYDPRSGWVYGLLDASGNVQASTQLASIQAWGAAVIDANVLTNIDIPNSTSYLTASTGFTVNGWALDLSAIVNSGISAVHVYAYDVSTGTPTFLGSAPLAGYRPDVGGYFGGQFSYAGFNLSASGLPAGTYDIVAFTLSSQTGNFCYSAPGVFRVVVH
jgi:hypothetical protein